MRTTRRCVLALATVLLLAGGCGDDDGQRLVIDGLDIDYDQDVYEVEPGPLTLEFRNRGQLAHNIVFEEVEGAPVAAGEDDFLAAGESATYELDLTAGEYPFFCSVPGHVEAGMVGTLIVG